MGFSLVISFWRTTWWGPWRDPLLSSQMSTKEPSASCGGGTSEDSKVLGQLSWGEKLRWEGTGLSVFPALRIVAPSTWMSNASREWGDAPVCSDL